MSSTNSSFHQNAIPSLQELLPVMIGYPAGFVLGFAGIVIGNNSYLGTPQISRGFWWAGLIVCVIFGGLILRSFKDWQLANELSKRGLITGGTITQHWTEEGKHAHYVCYSFDPEMKDGKNQLFSVKQPIRSSLHKELQVGTEVRVRFLPTDPIESTVSRIETSRWKYEY